MDPVEAVAILCAGAAAGAINAVVRSGTLITFPVLLGFGYAPVVANASNTVGLAPGSASAALGYRRELAFQRGRALRLGVASVVGGVVGALLLLVLPPAIFEAVVPAFIVLALVLILVQPRVAAWLTARNARRHEHGGIAAFLGMLGCGVYGGYFGAAQGVIAISVLGLAFDDELQRLNGLRNLLVGATNLVAAVVFAFSGRVAWEPAALIAGGSVLGGVLGAHVGRRLAAPVLRGVIVVVGTIALIKLVAP